MALGELTFIVFLFGVPIWLLLRAWRKYLAINYTAPQDLFQMGMGLTLITLSTAMWFVVLVLMLLEDHSAEAKSLAINLSPGKTWFDQSSFLRGRSRMLRTWAQVCSPNESCETSHRSQQRMPDADMGVFIREPALKST
jgi:hypothetical protein